MEINNILSVRKRQRIDEHNGPSNYFRLFFYAAVQWKVFAPPWWFVHDLDGDVLFAVRWRRHQRRSAFHRLPSRGAAHKHAVFGSVTSPRKAASKESTSIAMYRHRICFLHSSKWSLVQVSVLNAKDTIITWSLIFFCLRPGGCQLASDDATGFGGTDSVHLKLAQTCEHEKFICIRTSSCWSFDTQYRD